jgi:ankyrin repeat protein
MRLSFPILLPLPILLPTALLASVSAPAGIIEAVQQQNHVALRAMLKAGANPNTAEEDGTTALAYAAHFNDLESVRILLRAGGKAGAANDYGVTPLSEAAASGNAALVKELLRAGADPNSTTPEGETVLMTAARSGDVATLRLLIAKGAEVNRHEKWKGQTALMWAAAANRPEAARLLIGHGADVNARSAAVVPEIKRPANGNLVSEQPKGELTPLLFAAREGALETASVLLEKGAALNEADPDSITPVVMAIINGHYDVAALLLNAGADPNIADHWGRAALYAAIDMNTLEPSSTRPSPKALNRTTALDVARLALQKGADPNARLKNATPGRGIPDGPDPLLRAGATPFLRAAKTGDVAAMKLLLLYHADPMLTTDQKVDALMAAAGQGWRYGDSQIREADALEGVTLCVELGFDVNAVNARNETALHGAADRGATQIVEFLVSKGARTDVKDEKGHTPLDVAIGGEVRGHPGYPATASVLRKFSNQ